MTEHVVDDVGRGAPAVAAPEARRLAAAWARDLEARAEQMYEFLAAHVGELREDAATADITLAACSANLQVLLAMIRHGIAADRAEAPLAALEHARHMAARGAGIDVTLRFYRLGHAWFTEHWSTALVEKVHDPTRLLEAVRESIAVGFAYIDIVSGRVSAELVAERDRRQRRATAVRTDAVRGLLAGEPFDADRIEAALGFTLGGPILAFVCWTDGDPAALEHAVGALASGVGGHRPLLLAEEPNQLAGWTHLKSAREPRAAELSKVTAAAAPDVHVAIGGLGDGLDGFRDSRRQAERARDVAQRAGRPPPSFTRFQDVELVDLLSRDLPAAQALVRAELGALAAPGERTEVLRATLLAYLSARGSPAAAAAALGIHRNTALQRLRRAEELRGRPTGVHSHELLAALLLAQTLGDAVLA
jgi:DNA-binding PucR family transcriptional regulator